MARPAIVINTTTKGPWTSKTTRKSTGVTTFGSGESVRSSSLKTKPASISTPRSNPRPMTNFNSFSRVQIVEPSNITVMETPSYLYEYAGQTSFVRMDTVDIPTVPGWMVDESLQKALLKLRDGKVDLGVALAECRATADTINKTVERIDRQIRHFRRRNPKKVWRNILNAENVPNSWLELQYGWTPLLGDIVGSAAAVEAAEKNSLPGHIRVVGVVRDGVLIREKPRTIGNKFYPGWVGASNKLASTVLNYAADNPLLISMNQLGIVTPEVALWEVVPYSFIVDWFLPVGDWLSARTADYGWRFISGCNTQFVVTSAGNGASSHSWVNGSNRLRVSLNERARMAGYRFYRSVYNRSPTARLLLKNPLSDVGSVKRALSASAILQRNFRY